MKKTPIKPRSKKTAALYRNERVPLVKKLLEQRPVCQKCGEHRSEVIHELLPRGRGGSITDEENCVALCYI